MKKIMYLMAVFVLLVGFTATETENAEANTNASDIQSEFVVQQDGTSYVAVNNNGEITKKLEFSQAVVITADNTSMMAIEIKESHNVMTMQQSEIQANQGTSRIIKKPNTTAVLTSDLINETSETAAALAVNTSNDETDGIYEANALLSESEAPKIPTSVVMTNSLNYAETSRDNNLMGISDVLKIPTLASSDVNTGDVSQLDNEVRKGAEVSKLPVNTIVNDVVNAGENNQSFAQIAVWSGSLSVNS
jgi:hypothetical protein